MQRLALSAVVLLLALAGPAAAEEKAAGAATLEDAHAVREFADSFMDLVMAEKIQAAFDSALPYWPAASEAEVGALVLQTIRQREVVVPTYGEKVGIEFVREERLGGSFLRLLYLEKRELHALAWSFVFYSADGNTWRLNSLLWNDKAVEAL